MHLYLLLTYVNMLFVNRSIESICTVMQSYVHVSTVEPLITDTLINGHLQ
jgi:hypothetical protein